MTVGNATRRGVRRGGMIATVVLGALFGTGIVAAAEEAKPKRTVKEAAKTGGRTAKEGVLTFGHATKAFFTGGPRAAKEAWKAGAAKTKHAAKAGAAATKKAAE